MDRHTTLKNIDPRDIGLAQSASNYSIETVKISYFKYKFKTWENTLLLINLSLMKKEKRAEQIANLLCNHSVWKNHGHAINRMSQEIFVNSK